jgi:translation initiation factor 5A
MAGEITVGTVKDLKEGRFVVIDGEPCKVVNIEVSKPGKHGGAKARVDAISLFTGSRKTIMKPVDAAIEVPLIEKKAAQIVADLGNGRVQLMDLQTFENFELEVPEEWRSKIAAGAECEVQDVLGKKMLMRIKG